MGAKGVRDELDDLGIEHFGHEDEQPDEGDESAFMFDIEMEYPVRFLPLDCVVLDEIDQ